MRQIFPLFIFSLLFCATHAQTPSDITGLAGWFKSDSSSIEFGTNGNVAKWLDDSGNGLELIQSDITARPSLAISSEINDQLCLQFNGSNSYLDGGDILDISANGQSVFIVGRVLNDGYYFAKALYGGVPQRYALRYSADELSYLYHANSAIKAAATVPKRGFESIQISIDYSLEKITLLRNGNELLSLDSGPSYDMNSSFNYLVGAYNNSAGSTPPTSGLFLEGEIAEIIVFNRVLNNTESQLISDYIQNKYFPPKVSLGNDLKYELFCPVAIGTQHQYSKYQWSNGATSDSISVDRTGEYAVTVTDEFGFISSDTITVNFPALKPASDTICLGDNASLTNGLGNAFGYLWSTGETDHTITVASAGQYYCTITDSQGCDTVAYFSVIVDSLQADVYIPSDTALCKNNFISIVYDSIKYPDCSIKWNTGNAEQNIQILSADTYSVTVTDKNGCNALQSVNVSILGEAPIINFSVSNLCSNSTVLFEDLSSSASQIIDYKWELSNGDTSNYQNTKSQFQQGEQYAQLTVTEENGCSAQLRKNFFVANAPITTVEFDNTCINVPFSFNAEIDETDNLFSRIFWYKNSELISEAESDSYLITDKGEYEILTVAEDDSGCRDSVKNQLSVYESSLPPLPFRLSTPADRSYVYQDSVLFRWTESKGAVYYSLVVAMDAEFNEIVYQADKITELEQKLKLVAAGELFWKIAAYNICFDKIESGIYSFEKPSAFINTDLWLVADSATLENGKVMNWASINNSTLSVSQDDANIAPGIQNDALNGHSAVTFDGTQYLDGGDVLDMPTDGYSVFIVGKSNGSGTYYAKSLAGALPQRHAIFYAGDEITVIKHESANNAIIGHKFTSDYELISMTTSDSLRLFSDRLQEGSINVDSSFDMNSAYNFLIGAYNNNKGGVPPYGYYLNGAIAEMIIFQKEVTAQERSQIEIYLQKKYFPHKASFALDLGPDIFIEYGFADTLISAPGGFASYRWSTGSDSASTVIDTTGYYSLTVTDQYGLETTDDIYIEYPKVEIPDQTVCVGDSLPLALPFDPTAYTFTWSNGSTADTVWAKSNANWTVTVTDSSGYSFSARAFTVKLDEFPLTDALPSEADLCSGNRITPATGKTIISWFEWSSGSGEWENEIQTAGKYLVKITNQNNCLLTDSIQVTIKGIAPQLKINADTVCFGSETHIRVESASALTSRKWFIEGTTIESTTDTLKHQFSDFGEHIIRLDAETADGCDNYQYDTLRIGENPTAEAELLHGNFACTSAPLLISNKSKTVSDSIIKYTWSVNGQEFHETTPEITINQEGTYELTLRAESIFACTDSATQNIQVLGSEPAPCSPFVNMPENGAVFSQATINFSWENICNTQQLLLEIAADSTFSSLYDQLYITPGKESLLVDFAQNGEYWWRLKAFNACKDSIWNQARKFTLYKPQEIGGLALWLSADSAITTDENGSVSRWGDLSGNGKHLSQQLPESRPAFADKSLNLKPTVRFDGINDFMTGQNLYADEKELSIFVVHKFSGSRKNKGQFILNQAGDAGNKYSLHSIANKNFQLVYDSYPPKSAGAGDTQYGSDFFRLTSVVAGNGNSSIYTNGEVNQKKTSEDYTGIETEFVIGNRSSDFTDSWFAGDIAEILIFKRALSAKEQKNIESYLFTKYRKQAVNLGPDIYTDKSLCDTVIYAGKGYGSYIWSDNSTADSLLIRWDGTYSVTTTDGFGLSSNDDIKLYRDFIALNDTSVCIGNQLFIEPSMVADYRYLWSNGSTSNKISVVSTSVHSVTITDDKGCSISYAPITVTVDRFPLEVGFAADELAVCEGELITPVAIHSPSMQYQWQDASTLPYYEASADTELFVTVTNQNGCTGNDSAIVSIKGAPLQSYFTTDTACLGIPIQLKALSAPIEEQQISNWYAEGALLGEGSVIEYGFTDYGTFTVSLIDTSANGCASSYTGTVVVLPAPNADIASEQVCANESISLIDASMPADTASIISWKWTDGGSFISYNQNANYLPGTSATSIQLVVENSLGCKDSITKELAVQTESLAPVLGDNFYPPHNAQFSDSLVTFSWDEGLNIYRYSIEWSETDDFTTYNSKQVFSAAPTSIPLNGTGNYYWRLKAYNICNDSVSSANRKLTIFNDSLKEALLCWFDASANIGLDKNGNVQAWRSKYVNQTLSQANETSRPQYIKAGLNNKAVVRFDGADDYLSSTSLGINSGEYSVFAVHRFNAEKTSNLNTLFNQTTANGSKLLLFAPSNTNNTLMIQTYPPEQEAAGKAEYGRNYFSLTSAVADKNSILIWKNGLLNDSITPTTSAEAEEDFFLGTFSDNALQHCFSGEIAEIILFNRKLSNAEKDSIEDYLYNKYLPKLDLGDDIDYSLCKTEIGCDDVFFSYQWNKGDTANRIPASIPGNYSLQVTDPFGFEQIDSLLISRPSLNQLPDTTVCLNKNLKWFSGFDSRYDLIWSNGNTENNILISDAGTYSFTVFDSIGCYVQSEPINVAVDSFADKISLIARDFACEGELLYVDDPDKLAVSYQWNTGSTKSSETATASKSYTVTAFDSQGCSSVMQADITVAGTAPSISIIDKTVCQNSEKLLEASSTVTEGDTIISFDWEIGALKKQNGNSLLYKFGSQNSVPIKITAITELGCQGTYLDTLLPRTNAVLPIHSPKGNIHCLNDTITLSTNKANEAALKWYVSDVLFSNTPELQYSPQAIGDIAISLVASYANGCSSTNTDSFKIINEHAAPTSFELLSPSNNSNFYSGDTIRFSWTEAKNALAYEFELASDSLFENQLFLRYITDTAYATDQLRGGSFYWRIKAWSPCNEPLVSEKQEFSFKSPQLGSLPELWLIADSISGENGAKVARWNSIIGESPEQAVADQMPELVHNAIEGHSALRFDGMNDYLTAGDTFDIGTTGQTAFIVSKSNTSKGALFNKAIYSGMPDRYSLFYNGSELQFLFHDNQARKAFARPRIGTFALNAYCLNKDSATIDLYDFDALEMQTSTAGPIKTNSAFDFLIGAYNNNQGSVPPTEGLFLNGEIAEIILYNSPLNNAEIKIVNEYLIHKYFPQKTPVDLDPNITVSDFCPITLKTNQEYVNYSWSTGETSSTITVSESGSYSVTVTDAYGFISSDSVKVSFPGGQTEQVDLCLGETVNLSPKLGDAYSYLWLSGETSSEISVDEEGTYVAVVTDINSCSREFYYEVVTDSLINEVYLPADTSLCEFNFLCPKILTNKQTSILWNDGSVDCLNITSNGDYTVTITDERGCQVTKSTKITLKGIAPEVGFSVDRLCAKTPANFSYNANMENILSYSWQWGNGSEANVPSPTIRFENPGDYSLRLEVKDKTGCSAYLTDTITISQLPEAQLQISNACLGLANEISLHIDSSTATETINWQMGDGSVIDSIINEHTYAEAGEYAVRVSIEDSLSCAIVLNDTLTVFETLPQADKPQPLYPSAFQTIFSDSIQFAWQSNASSYNIKIFTDSLAQELLFEHRNIRQRQASLLLPYIDTLYWQIEASNLCKETVSSDMNGFKRFSPASIANNSLWMIADSINLADSSAITHWNSTSEPVSVSAADPETAPLLLKNSINGHAAVSFDGINDYFDGGDIMDIPVKGQSVFIVAKKENDKCSFYAKSYYGNKSLRTALFYNNDALNFIHHDNSLHKISIDINNEYSFYTATVDLTTGTAKLYNQGINAGAVNLSPGFDMNSSYNFLIGAYNNSDGSIPPVEDFYLKGEIAEIIFYSRPLDETERISVEQYLRHKYFPQQIVDPVDLGEDLIVEYGFCPQIIQAGNRFSSYTWNTGAISHSIEVTEPGKYSVTVTDEYGIASSDEIVVRFPAQRFYPKAVCAGDSLKLAPELGAGYTYLWNNASEDEFVYADQKGEYFVELTDTAQNCAFSITYAVSVDSFALQAFIADTIEACKWSSLCLNYDQARYKGISNIWNSRDTALCLKLEDEGWQHLIAKDINGCLFKDSSYVSIQGEAPNAQFEAIGLCENATVRLKNKSVSSSQISSAKWFINDSLISEEYDADYVARSAGSHTVTLQLEETGGCLGELTDVVDIVPSTAVNLSVTDVCLGNLVSLQADTEGLTLDSLLYSIDGNVAESISEQLFTDAGTHHISALAYDQRGCLFIANDTVSVFESFTAPSSFKLLAPLHGQLFKESMVEFEWDAADNASYYRLEIYETTQTGAEPLSVTDSIYGTALELQLPYKQKLYWSVVAVNICGDEYVSDFRSFTIFAPQVINGIEAWFIADSALKLSNDAVQEWGNLIDPKKSVKSPNIGSSPVFSDSTLNNHAVLEFDGIDDYFDGGDIFDMSEEGKTFFIVAHANTPNNSIIAKSLYGGNPGRYFALVDENTKLRITLHDDNAHSVISKSAITGPAYHLISYDANRKGQIMRLFKNRILEGETEIQNTRDLNTNYNFLIGAYNNETGTIPPQAGFYLNGGIAEIIMYNRPLNDNERALVEEYLMKKYFPDQVHDDIVMDNQQIVPYGFCETMISPEPADWHVSYQWSTGSKSIGTTVSEPGVYRLSITDQLGIEYTDSIFVRYKSFPQTIEGKELCFGEILEWETGLNSDYSFHWSDGSSQTKLSIFSPGEYWLQISDTLGCEYQSDTIRVNVDSLPLIDLLGNSRSACLHERLRIEVPNAVRYQWSNGETGKEIFITSEGDYKLTVTDDQSCTAADSVRFTINGTAPILAPIVENTCFGDTSMISLSVSNEVILDSSLWYAGDSIIKQPQLSFTFDEGLNYVPVRAWAGDGCSDSITVEININPLPIAHFMPRVACERQTARFFDRSEPTQGRLEANSWFVDGKASEDVSSVEKLFENAGRYYVSISVTDSYGCTDSAGDSVEVRPAPVPDFVHTPICDEQTSFFFNRVETQTYNQILDYQWVINETEIHQSDIYYYISELDSIAVSLTAKAINGCSSTASKLLPVGRQPKAKFGGEEVCLHDSIQFTDSSTVQTDNITNWEWLLDKEDSLLGQNPKYLFADTGSYNISLQITTDKGCIDTASQTVIVHPLPKAEFSFHPKFGGAPLPVTFINESEAATHFEWDVNGETMLYDEQPSYIFSNTGSFYVKLRSINTFGCSDTANHFINTYISNYNIIIQKLEVKEYQGHYRISVEFQNLSPDAVYMLNFILQDPQIGLIKESWEGELLPGAKDRYTFESQIFMQNNSLPEYICLELQVADNQNVYFTTDKCISTTEELRLYDIFPNPAEDDIKISFGLPSEGTYIIEITEATGRILFSIKGDGLAGYNENTIITSPLAPAVYFIRLRFNDEIKTASFVKGATNKK